MSLEIKNVWRTYNSEQLAEIENISERYKYCLNAGKTERECVEVAIKLAENVGYRNLKELHHSGKSLKPGDKIYAVNMNKMIALFCLGTEALSSGMNILGAHIDSPRIDVKQNPLYENEGFAYFDTHYYGGIKKYQWIAQPLSIHGVVVKTDGTIQKVMIGEDEKDPVFVITDLLVHLAQEQMEKKASKIIEGEKLDVLIGNRPIIEIVDRIGITKDNGVSKNTTIKANILKLLYERYSIGEEDLVSAELEIVPAGKARDCGLDRSMILSYGQDDRACAFSSLFAMLDISNTKKTGCCLLVDKEEIGSVGATGMQSRFFENIIAELVAMTEGGSELKVRRALMNSRMLSADVSAAYDPMFAEVFEKRSSAFLAQGLSFNKFTGKSGKTRANDANPEYIADLRKCMDRAGVKYQFSEIGKVDVGGGGSIAYIMARYGMNVIDSGVAVLNMHAPYEVTSKADIYEAVKGYRAFLEMN